MSDWSSRFLNSAVTLQSFVCFSSQTHETHIDSWCFSYLFIVFPCFSRCHFRCVATRQPLKAQFAGGRDTHLSVDPKVGDTRTTSIGQTVRFIICRFRKHVVQIQIYKNVCMYMYSVYMYHGYIVVLFIPCNIMSAFCETEQFGDLVYSLPVPTTCHSAGMSLCDTFEASDLYSNNHCIFEHEPHRDWCYGVERNGWFSKCSDGWRFLRVNNF